MKTAIGRILDWRLRSVLRRSGLPDLPEVRKLMRASYWHGFTFGAAYARELPALREQSLHAIVVEVQRRAAQS